MTFIRALVVDIDGTLSDDKRVLCPKAVQAIRKIKVPVILCTGNTHCFTRAVSVLLGTPRIFISENGGVISHSEEDVEVLADLKVCNEAFEKLSVEFPLKRYNSARYRFTDIALERTFDASKAALRAEELGLPAAIWRSSIPAASTPPPGTTRCWKGRRWRCRTRTPRDSTSTTSTPSGPRSATGWPST